MNNIQTFFWVIIYSKGRREASFHPSVSSFIHSSDHPSIPSWSVYSDRAEKEWNTDTTWRRIILIFIIQMKKTHEEGNTSVFQSGPELIFSAHQCSSKSIPTGHKFVLSQLKNID
jgi:hypothetical protein